MLVVTSDTTRADKAADCGGAPLVGDQAHAQGVPQPTHGNHYSKGAADFKLDSPPNTYGRFMATEVSMHYSDSVHDFKIDALASDYCRLPPTEAGAASESTA